ncbi:MAG: ribonuclease P protein component [Leptolyngbyaceae cyanobacterium CSU_1_3]|nr:ribonuclease P protein component [Leptolyngbyaceae cyanobacterium CSU_1_3]
MALPKTNRLKRRRDFNTVYQRGIRRNSANLALRALPPSRQKGLQSPPPPSQIGISISKKVSKHAVVRNRIKRQIRAALRQLLFRLPDGWKVVIVVRSEATQCDYSQFLQELEQLLVEAEVLNGN